MKEKKAIEGLLGGVKVGDSFPVRTMGVINLTANSFFSGSVKVGSEEIVRTAKEMEESGADFIDLGARSTAPYRKYDISENVETNLIKEATRVLCNKLSLPISIDTTRIEPAKAGVKEGAVILNDVYGLHERAGQQIVEIALKNNCSLILCAHEMRQKQGAPIERIVSSLAYSVEKATSAGVDSQMIAVDPGIGFFKDDKLSNVAWNSEVISKLSDLRGLGFPLCVGVSRKSFIGTMLGDIPPVKRLSGSLAAASIAVYNGAHIVRTHDVLETCEALKVACMLRALT